MSRRRFWMLVHRVNGLLLAAFLSVVGLTGSVIAWNDALERVFAPALFVLPHHSASQARVDPLRLRELAAAAHPEAAVNDVDLQGLPDAPAQFSLEPLVANIQAPPAMPVNDTVFVDPYTGAVLGERRAGDIGQGRKNLIPFIYRLHEDLALGDGGMYCLGVAALLWTIDCFIGMYLTFPARTKATGLALSQRVRHWPGRWFPSWRVRWRQGSAKRTYDLHRAGGLWVWVMLLIFAWSGVAFNLPAVYRPVMKLFGSAEAPRATAPSFCDATSTGPIRWRDSYVTAQALMEKEARRGRFQVRSERFLSYDPENCVFTYRVKSTLDIGMLGNTQILFTRTTGRLLTTSLPTGQTRADTFSTWIENLHEAQVFGLWFRVVVCLSGLMVATLSVTGILIFLKKLRRPWFSSFSA